MSTYINGIGGSIVFASATFQVASWTLKVENGILDVTNTGSGSYGQFISGINSGSVECKAFWDQDNIPTGTAGLVPGASGTLTLHIGSSGKSVTCSGVIMSIGMENAPTAPVSWDLSLKLTTSPVYPS